MLYHLLITPLLLGILIAAWLGFQAWVRKRSPGMRPDADVLQGRFSCGTCFEFESCHATLTRPGDASTRRDTEPRDQSRRDAGSVSDTDIPEVNRVHEITL